MKTKRQGYRFGVEWIALNDDPLALDAEAVEATISVALLADLFGKRAMDVASDVIRFRERARVRGLAHDEAARS